MEVRNFPLPLGKPLMFHTRAQLLSCVLFFVTPGTKAPQALLSVGFSRQEYWSGLPFPPPGDLPDPGIEPVSLCISCVVCFGVLIVLWVGKIPWRRKWQLTPVFLPGKSHGQRSLAGYS